MQLKLIRWTPLHYTAFIDHVKRAAQQQEYPAPIRRASYRGGATLRLTRGVPVQRAAAAACLCPQKAENCPVAEQRLQGGGQTL